MFKSTLKPMVKEAAKQNRHKKLQDLQRNARRDEGSLLQLIADMSARLAKAMQTLKQSDTVRNRALAEHHQKMSGAIGRLAKTWPIGAVPKRADLLAKRTAFKTLDQHRDACGKRSKINRCVLSNDHINQCREEL